MCVFCFAGVQKFRNFCTCFARLPATQNSVQNFRNFWTRPHRYKMFFLQAIPVLWYLPSSWADITRRGVPKIMCMCNVNYVCVLCFLFLLVFKNSGIFVQDQKFRNFRTELFCVVNVPMTSTTMIGSSLMFSVTVFGKEKTFGQSSSPHSCPMRRSSCRVCSKSRGWAFHKNFPRGWQ